MVLWDVHSRPQTHPGQPALPSCQAEPTQVSGGDLASGYVHQSVLLAIPISIQEKEGKGGGVQLQTWAKAVQVSAEEVVMLCGLVTNTSFDSFSRVFLLPHLFCFFLQHSFFLNDPLVSSFKQGRKSQENMTGWLTINKTFTCHVWEDTALGAGSSLIHSVQCYHNATKKAQNEQQYSNITSLRQVT